MSVLWSDDGANCTVARKSDRQKRLLLIEEDEIVAAGVKNTLEGINFNVDIACNGANGLRMALEGHYELIIMDLMLPVRDSWMICEAIRTQGWDLPILMLNARDGTEIQAPVPGRGAHRQLPEPFDPCELQGRIRAML